MAFVSDRIVDISQQENNYLSDVGSSLSYSNQSTGELVELSREMVLKNPFLILRKNEIERFSDEQKRIYGLYCSVNAEIDKRDRETGLRYKLKE